MSYHYILKTYELFFSCSEFNVIKANVFHAANVKMCVLWK